MTYDEQRQALITYLKHKCEIGDWHGVSDAANDLRVLEAQQLPRSQSEVKDPAKITCAQLYEPFARKPACLEP